MEKLLQKLLTRINELDQIIDRETDDADAGCDWSKGLIINAEVEKEDLKDQLLAISLFGALTI